MATTDRANVPRVLIIAGSDSGGGAGIQADIKTCSALGAFATTAVTALTAQDTTGVHGVQPVPAPFVTHQIDVVCRDIGVHVIKTGMLPNSQVIDAIASGIESMSSGYAGAGSPQPLRNATDIDATLPAIPLLVLDPVMVSASGHSLIDPSAVAALKTALLPKAAIVTPNLPEASALLDGRVITDVAGMRAAAADIATTFGPRAVLLKGGHLENERSVLVTDVLYDAVTGEFTEFSSPRIPTRNSHGTGCTLASAIAAFLARAIAALPPAAAALPAAAAALPAAAAA